MKLSKARGRQIRNQVSLFVTQLLSTPTKLAGDCSTNAQFNFKEISGNSDMVNTRGFNLLDQRAHSIVQEPCLHVGGVLS